MSDAPRDASAAMEQALRALGRLPPARPLDTEGLVLTLKPREEGLADKQLSVEELFRKITSMRDKLRVLEQRVNASDVPRDEKAELQAHITQVYDAFATLAAFFSEDALPSAPAPLAEETNG